MSSEDSLVVMSDSLMKAVQAGGEAKAWLLEHGSQNRNGAGGVSVNFMMLCGFLCGGWIMGQSALKAVKLLQAGAGDESFLTTKQVTAQFYFDHLLPRTGSYLAMIKAGTESMMALDVEQF
jgi:hypothetical protein